MTGEEPADRRDLVDLLIEQLESDEQAVSATRRDLHRKIDTFADELATRRERYISAFRRMLHREIDELAEQQRGEHDAERPG